MDNRDAGYKLNKTQRIATSKGHFHLFQQVHQRKEDLSEEI